MEPESRTRPRPIYGLLAVLLTAMLLIAFGMAWQVAHPRGASEQASSQEAAVGLTLYTNAERPQLPVVSGTTLDGEPLSLENAQGHILVVNVWGSWCGPCRKEAPDLVSVASETASAGVWFVGIDVRDNPAAARAFTRRYKIEYPSLDDQKGKALAKFAGLIPISAVPSTLVVDTSGGIAARIVGRVDAATLRGIIDDLSVPDSDEAPT